MRELQLALNRKYGAGLVPDGDWGAKTQKALLSNKLPVVIYWKQYSEITGYKLNTDGTAEAGNWWEDPFKYLTWL